MDVTSGSYGQLKVELNQREKAMNGPEALNVFFDTSVFRKMNFYYAHPAFAALIEHVLQERCNVLITQITVDEICSGVVEEVTDALQTLKKARNASKILRNSLDATFASVFRDHDIDGLANELMAQFESFKTTCKMNMVSIENADITKVFASYFNKTVPFGEGKKKSEFPDAFVLSALDAWAAEEGKEIYVVSQDKDLKNCGANFPRLIYLNSIEKFLNLTTLYFEKLAPLASELLKSNESEIKKRIEEEFTNLGFILEDQDGEVEEVTVVEVDTFEGFLISLRVPIDDKPGEAHFQLTTKVSFSAELSYDNLETASYDSEEKVLIPWETVDKTVERDEIVQVDFIFSFLLEPPHNFEIETLRIETPIDVYVSSDEDEGWPPYK